MEDTGSSSQVVRYSVQSSEAQANAIVRVYSRVHRAIGSSTGSANRSTDI